MKRLLLNTLKIQPLKVENKPSVRTLAFFFLCSTAVHTSSPNVQQQMTWLNSLFYKKGYLVARRESELVLQFLPEGCSDGIS